MSMYYKIFIFVIFPFILFSQNTENNNSEEYIKDVTSIDTTSENKSSKSLFLKFGLGLSSFRSENINTTNFESEIEYSFNPYFAYSLGLNYSKSIFGDVSFVQGNVDLVISLLKNTEKNNFRFGWGISYTRISEFDFKLRKNSNGNIVTDRNKVSIENALSANVFSEYTFTFHGKYLLGLKVFAHPFLTTEENNTGFSRKTGIKLF